MNIYAIPLEINNIYLNSIRFLWILVESSEVWWSPVKSDALRFRRVWERPQALLSRLNIVKHWWTTIFYVFVAFEIGRRRLFLIENGPKSVNISEIHICIVLLPWIRPQAPFSKWIFCKHMQHHALHKKLLKTFRFITEKAPSQAQASPDHV